MRTSEVTSPGVPASGGTANDRVTTQPTFQGANTSPAQAEFDPASSCCRAPRSGASGSGEARTGIVERFLVGCIHAYQGVRAGRPSPCRFLPSCSAYGEEAISVHGPVRGCVLTFKRIARCRPGGGFGVDLVPPRS